jgi:hypothetical protein
MASSTMVGKEGRREVWLIRSGGLEASGVISFGGGRGACQEKVEFAEA